MCCACRAVPCCAVFYCVYNLVSYPFPALMHFGGLSTCAVGAARVWRSSSHLLPSSLPPFGAMPVSVVVARPCGWGHAVAGILGAGVVSTTRQGLGCSSPTFVGFVSCLSTQNWRRVSGVITPLPFLCACWLAACPPALRASLMCSRFCVVSTGIFVFLRLSFSVTACGSHSALGPLQVYAYSTLTPDCCIVCMVAAVGCAPLLAFVAATAMVLRNP